IIRAVIHKRVNAHDGVEELGGEWQGPCVRVDRENPVLYAGIADPLEVLGDAEPQVSGPYLDAELTVEKDRGQGAPAAEVQHAHAGPQVQRPSKPLGQPQGIGPAADAGNDPPGVIRRRAGKVLQEEPLIHVAALPLGRTRQMSRAPWWHDGPRHSARVGSIWMLGGRLSMGHSSDGN